MPVKNSETRVMLFILLKIKCHIFLMLAVNDCRSILIFFVSALKSLVEVGEF